MSSRRLTSIVSLRHLTSPSSPLLLSPSPQLFLGHSSSSHHLTFICSSSIFDILLHFLFWSHVLRLCRRFDFIFSISRTWAYFTTLSRQFSYLSFDLGHVHFTFSYFLKDLSGVTNSSSSRSHSFILSFCSFGSLASFCFSLACLA